MASTFKNKQVSFIRRNTGRDHNYNYTCVPRSRGDRSSGGGMTCAEHKRQFLSSSIPEPNIGDSEIYKWMRAVDLPSGVRLEIVSQLINYWINIFGRCNIPNWNRSMYRTRVWILFLLKRKEDIKSPSVCDVVHQRGIYRHRERRNGPPRRWSVHRLSNAMTPRFVSSTTSNISNQASFPFPNILFVGCIPFARVFAVSLDTFHISNEFWCLRKEHRQHLISNTSGAFILVCPEYCNQ